MLTRLFLVIALSISAYGGPDFTVRSPNGKVSLEIELSESGPTVRYGAFFEGRPVVHDSSLVLDLAGQESLGHQLQLVRSQTNEVRESWTRPYGRRIHVSNTASELVLEFTEAEGARRPITWIFRAYDDGIAFRYHLPDHPSLASFALTRERTEFRFAQDATVWAAEYSGFSSSQEEHFKPGKLNDLSPFKTYGCPLLLQVDEGTWALLTEAAVTDWAGMYLSHSSTERNTLVTTLASRLDDPTVVVRGSVTRHSPWRVLMLGAQPGRMLESDLLVNLNEPCAIPDTSWIKPGKAAWDRWWSGDFMPDVNFKVGMNNETMKYFIDFASEMGWEYQIIDWQWYGEPFHPEKGYKAAHPKADITRSIPEVDVPSLVAYAQARGVRLFLWLEWSQTDKQMDEAFALYEKWGIAGVKIDFMDSDSQERVNFYHRCVKLAAQHKLLVDFHGAYKPDGWSRTYPNVITREGILGNEYNKWSDKVTPDHCLTIPFTRGALGEMDFTPGGWRHKGQGQFRAGTGGEPGPFVMGTRCFQMAMLVVYESAFQVLCDSPFAYRSSPAGLDFLKIVPTSWDDTVVPHGQVGDSIAVARRSGDTWYVGAMTDWTARTIRIPLHFLGDGEFEAEIWQDAYDVADYPERLRKSTLAVTSKGQLEAIMSSGGGYVAVLRPKR